MNNFQDGGKYEAACTVARESCEARGVVLIVVDGKLGSGFSVQMEPQHLIRLPDALEMMAKEIRSQLKAEKN